MLVCSEYCKLHHNHPLCTDCRGLINTANLVTNHGFYPLSAAFKSSFPDVSYSSATAKRKLLQMPLAAITLGEPATGKSCVYLMEAVDSLDYQKLINFLESKLFNGVMTGLSKGEVKELLSFAKSDREREVLRYSVYRASGLTSSAARKLYGWERMSDRSLVVEESLREAQALQESIEDLCVTQERALLRSLGIEPETSDTSDDDSVCESDELPSDLPGVRNNTASSFPSKMDLNETLSKSQYNWFDVVANTLAKCDGEDEEEIVTQLDTYYSTITASEMLNCEQHRLLQQSYNAFNCDRERRLPLARAQAAAVNGDIVTDSDSDDSEQYLGLQNVRSDRAKALVLKKRKTLRRRARHMNAKMFAERNFLARKQSKAVRGILKDHPNIGQVIEDYVQERNVGADAWRRTGVLTFDGNTKVKQKVTFNRIKEHLESVYDRKFSYGTIVQLCVARNRRRRSACRYKGVAHVTCRRARKGFQLKFNPDSHWSNALYRGLNMLQYTDGQHILLINRDDAAGFRLDTMATHRLHRTPMVQGSQALTTYTDYVNRYPSLLQTTSYNFTGTQSTSEVCVGVVKASGVYPKNPAQHAADIEFLQKQPELQAVFTDAQTNLPKSIVSVRVDGGSDEGPSHEEVQFFWTVHHINTPSVSTLVSARNSGASYLNRVELQNGCQALAHANLFVPSTLGGSCLDSKTGKVDPEKFKHNMKLATEVYMTRVNGCPCGEGTIKLYEGADSTTHQELRGKVIQFLKGTKQQKRNLQQQHPEAYSYIEGVWAVRNAHMTRDVPLQYLFHLVCCFKPSCSHPLCKAGSQELPQWFTSGPCVSYLPLPVPDPARPWDSTDCSTCNGPCSGHFMEPEVAMLSLVEPMRQPPSTVIREVFKGIKGSPTDVQIEETAKKVLLSPSDVRIWFEHLQTVRENRRRGAQKAAATRRKKKIERRSFHDVYFCGVCHDQYVDFTEEEEDWIQCEGCSMWFHFTCVGIECQAVPETFYCEDCNSANH